MLECVFDGYTNIAIISSVLRLKLLYTSPFIPIQSTFLKCLFSSLHTFLGQLRFWMGIVWVARKHGHINQCKLAMNLFGMEMNLFGHFFPNLGLRTFFKKTTSFAKRDVPNYIEVLVLNYCILFIDFRLKFSVSSSSSSSSITFQKVVCDNKK